MRVAAVRWAAEPLPAGEPGGGDRGRQAGRDLRALRRARALHLRRGLAGVAARVTARGDALVLGAVAAAGVDRAGGAAARARRQTLAPAAIDPELGYVELAGFSPDGTSLLVAREARMTGPLGQPDTLAPWVARSFQILRVDERNGGLTVEKQASHLDNFVTFRRWAAASWQRSTLALR